METLELSPSIPGQTYKHSQQIMLQDKINITILQSSMRSYKK